MNYEQNKDAEKYLNFLSSSDGQILQQVIFSALSKKISNEDKIILDAGCGSGWLAKKISLGERKVFGCDNSSYLLSEAKKNAPEINFILSDLAEDLPYNKNFFDCIILNLVINDVKDQFKVLNNLKTILKAQGKIIIIMVNPYYAYPIGVWKRNLLDVIFKRKPKIKIYASYYNHYQKKEPLVDKPFSPFSYFEDTLQKLFKAGFTINYFEEIKAAADSSEFDLNFQLSRFPLLFLIQAEVLQK